MDLEPHRPDNSQLIAWLKKLAKDIGTMLRWIEGQVEPALPLQHDPSYDTSDDPSSGTTHDHQRQRLQAFGVHTNALVRLRGNPEQGGLLMVNANSVNLSPTEWPFARAGLDHRIGHLASIRPQKDERLNPNRG